MDPNGCSAAVRAPCCLSLHDSPISVPICWGLWAGVLRLVHSAVMQPWGTLGTSQASLLGLPQSIVAGASIPCWEMTAPSWNTAKNESLMRLKSAGSLASHLFIIHCWISHISAFSFSLWRLPLEQKCEQISSSPLNQLFWFESNSSFSVRWAALSPLFLFCEWVMPWLVKSQHNMAGLSTDTQSFIVSLQGTWKKVTEKLRGGRILPGYFCCHQMGTAHGCLSPRFGSPQKLWQPTCLLWQRALHSVEQSALTCYLELTGVQHSV